MTTAAELIGKLQDRMDQRFDALEKKADEGFSKLEERLRQVEIGWARTGEQVEGIDKRLCTVEQKGNRRNGGNGKGRFAEIFPVIVKWILLAVVIGGALATGRILQAIGWLK